MSSNPPTVSVVAPLTPAIEWVKVVLFRPFDLQRWLVIGFCAWLAQLGQNGGGGGHGGGPRSSGDIREGLGRARDYVVDNLEWIIPLVAVSFLVILGLWLLFTWLSSRGRFMFLHCVAGNRAEVSVPWRSYAAHGNSLFLFRLVVGLVSFLILTPAIIGAVVFFLALLSGEGPRGILVLGLVGCIVAAILFGSVVSVVAKFTKDFVVPIMARYTPNALEGWRRFISLLNGNIGSFVLYLLFQILLHVGIGVLIFGVVLLTCCCAGCLLVIPYVGTVLLLPILVFHRSYSLYYLAQFGHEFDIINQPTADVPPLMEPEP